MGGIELHGMTWRHRLAIDPLLGTLDGFRARHPGIDIAWGTRQLAGFQLTPYDYCVIKVHTDAGDLAWAESPFPIDSEVWCPCRQIRD